MFHVLSEGAIYSLDLNSAAQENQVEAKGRDELGRATWKITPAEQNVHSVDDVLPSSVWPHKFLFKKVLGSQFTLGSLYLPPKRH